MMWLVELFPLGVQAQSWRSIGIQLPDREAVSSATKCSSSHHNFLGWVPSASLTSHSSPHIPPSCPSSAFLSFFPLSRWTVFSDTSPSLPNASSPFLSLFFPLPASLVCVLLHLPSSLLFQHLLASGFLPTSSFPSPLGFTHFSFLPNPEQRNIFVFGIPLPSFSLSHAQKLPIL